MSGPDQSRPDQIRREEPGICYLDLASGVHLLTEPAIRSAIDELRLPPGSLGLDAGCGNGDHTLWLAESISPGGRVTGIDHSGECLSYAEAGAARRGLSSSVTFEPGDIRRLQFEDGRFDWAWAADSLWPGPRSLGFVGEDVAPAIKELVRVVRPGGVVAVLFWSSQRLIPGYPLLESRLNDTLFANRPYEETTDPGAHIMCALGWLRKAGLEDARARTFVADIQAPLDRARREALAGCFQMLWGKAKTELSGEDYEKFQLLCMPESKSTVLDSDDYYAFITYTLFHGRMAGR